jgi:DNA-binding PadR family transcriptional regulator
MAPPLTPAVFHVLLALAPGERHGYGIQKDVLEHTGGAVRLGPGTLYGTLQRLMALDWVEEKMVSGAAADERRRYYRLTKTGRKSLEAEVQRMDALLKTARAHNIVPRRSKS